MTSTENCKEKNLKENNQNVSCDDGLWLMILKFLFCFFKFYYTFLVFYHKLVLFCNPTRIKIR